MPCGPSACRKSLAEFRARRRERHVEHFSRRRVRREKYTPVCKCAGCPPLADGSCAQQAAACCRKTPKEFFDSNKVRTAFAVRALLQIPISAAIMTLRNNSDCLLAPAASRLRYVSSRIVRCANAETACSIPARRACNHTAAPFGIHILYCSVRGWPV